MSQPLAQLRPAAQRCPTLPVTPGTVTPQLQRKFPKLQVETTPKGPGFQREVDETVKGKERRPPATATKKVELQLRGKVGLQT